MTITVLVVVLAGLALVLGSDLCKRPRVGPRSTSGQTIYGRARQELDDARSDASRCIDQLAAGILDLDGASSVAAGQRLHTATVELSGADSIAQFAQAKNTAIEGLRDLRSCRVALGIQPGPELLRLSVGRAI
jgi:hypothetical protein